MRAELEEFRRSGCRFLVAGRVDESGRFVSCADLDIPADVCELFAGIPQDRFRVDVSSTQLRSD